MAAEGIEIFVLMKVRFYLNRDKWMVAITGNGGYSHPAIAFRHGSGDGNNSIDVMCNIAL
jgi:hypothetical protein